jgi:imidazolonepropionase-like amidohydrolase
MDQLLARRRAFDEGRLIGPRVVMAGIIDGPGPYAGPTNVLVDTPAAARAAVARYAAHGFVQIKIYSSVKPELVPVLVEEAHRRGLRVSGHIPAFMSAEQAVRAGYDEIQHANFLFLNFWADSVPDTRTPARFTAVGERAAGLDLDGAPVREFIALLKERHVAVDPTLNIFESLLTARRGTVSAGDAAIADRLPPQIRRGLLSGGLPVPEGMDQRYRDSFAQMPRLIKRLYDAGVVIEAGTDAAPGFALHRELELYSAAGIPNAEVLRLATLGAARVMGVERERGSIAPGKQADLVLVDGDPLERIGDIRRTEWVVKDGWLYRSADLYQAVGVVPAVGSPGR